MKHKIRAILKNQEYGDYYGLVVPKEAFEKFGDDTKFVTIIKKDRIIFKSGADVDGND